MPDGTAVSNVSACILISANDGASASVKKVRAELEGLEASGKQGAGGTEALAQSAKGVSREVGSAFRGISHLGGEAVGITSGLGMEFRGLSHVLGAIGSPIAMATVGVVAAAVAAQRSTPRPAARRRPPPRAPAAGAKSAAATPKSWSIGPGASAIPTRTTNRVAARRWPWATP